MYRYSFRKVWQAGCSELRLTPLSLSPYSSTQNYLIWMYKTMNLDMNSN